MKDINMIIKKKVRKTFSTIFRIVNFVSMVCRLFFGDSLIGLIKHFL